MNEGLRALGRLPVGQKNKTEDQYEAMLKDRLSQGVIAAYKFEPMKLRLADLTSYTPDFMVITAEGHVEFHEVKGFWTDDARVKIKVAAELFPWFKFVAVQKEALKRGGGWKIEEF